MRPLVLLYSLMLIGACASAVQSNTADSSFTGSAKPAEVADSAQPDGSASRAPGESAGTSRDAAIPSRPASVQPQTTATASRDPVTQTRTGRFRTELLQDKEFRLVFGDLQRLKVVVDFHESRWGLLKLLMGSGFDSVSSAGFNLEHLYRAYKAASYYSSDIVVELWRDGAKIGEVTDAGVLVGPEFKVPRDPF
jgi:hypothetical protein